MRTKLLRPRWLARLYADFMGYFWLPCPSCGVMFGGFEASDRFGVGVPYRDRPGVSRMVCGPCGEVRYRGNNFGWPQETPRGVGRTGGSA